jgi:hypothetical protein
MIEEPGKLQLLFFFSVNPAFNPAFAGKQVTLLYDAPTFSLLLPQQIQGKVGRGGLMLLPHLGPVGLGLRKP